MLSGREARLWNREQKIVNPPSTGIWSLYLDGSLTPKGPLRHVVENEWLKEADFALYRHPHRSCAYAEIDACVERKKIHPSEAEKARSHLMLAGFPRDYGLWACGVVARRSRENTLQMFMSVIWWEFTRQITRDQIWFPFALWKIEGARKRVHTIDADIFDSPHFTFKRHR